MTRLFRREIYGVLAAMLAVIVSYRAGVNYLPSIFLIVAGVLMFGVFSELEDDVLLKIEDHSIQSYDWHLTLLRIVRSIVLLTVGVLIFVLLGRQF